MLPFQAEDFLLVRELGDRQDAADHAVSLLGRACPGASADALLRLTLGRRNAQLLDLRERLFGRGLEAFAECPHCGQALEFAVEIDALRAPFANDPAGAELELEADGYRVRFRLLDSGDLKAAAACADLAAARALLIERCVLEAQRDGAVVAAADLPETVLERTANRMEAADPQAETLIDLVCPACDARVATGVRHRLVSLRRSRRARATHPAGGARARARLWLEREGHSGDERAPPPRLSGDVAPMTDFLTRIARTALGLTPVAKVLGASRYAPGPDFPTPQILQPDVEVALAARPGTTHAGVPPANPASHHRPETTPVSSAIDSHAIDSRVDAPALPALARVERASDAPPEARRSRAPLLPRIAQQPGGASLPPLVGDTLPHRAAMPVADGVIPATVQAPAPVSDVRSAAATPPLSAAATWLTRSEAYDQPPESPQQISAPEDVVEMTETVEDAHADGPPSLSGRVVRPHSILPSHPSGIEQATDPSPIGPIIRVTIGRVDVRAIAPAPPPPQPPAPPASRLSLDEYLRQHNGRRR